MVVRVSRLLSMHSDYSSCVDETSPLCFNSPLGAGLLSLYIIFDWAHTCLSHVDRLSGAAVNDVVLRKLVFLAWRFSPVVKAYKNLKAYYAGDGVWVECDVLLEPKTDLRHAHDVAELMQYCESWRVRVSKGERTTYFIATAQVSKD